MSDRIERLFQRCRRENRSAFIPYICAGDPSFKRTVELALALEAAGGDLLELGVPFSDPLADGVVNQLAAQRALDAGATIDGVLDCVGRIRGQSDIPLVLYTYFNPVFQFGISKFYEEAAGAGVDGLLVLDLPPDEGEQSVEAISHIRLLAPTTSPDRLRTLTKSARGFVYYISREGVTGMRGSIAEALDEKIDLIRTHTDLPIAVGFGISNPEHARSVARLADAVVVGSAIVDLIGKTGDSPVLAGRVAEFARPIAAAIHNARR